MSHTTVRPSGARTIVSAPFSRTTAPKRSAVARSGFEPVRGDPRGLDVEQPCQLAGVRSENGGRVAWHRLEAEEPVRVDDHR